MTSNSTDALEKAVMVIKGSAAKDDESITVPTLLPTYLPTYLPTCPAVSVHLFCLLSRSKISFIILVLHLEAPKVTSIE